MQQVCGGRTYEAFRLRRVHDEVAQSALKVQAARVQSPVRVSTGHQNNAAGSTRSSVVWC